MTSNTDADCSELWLNILITERVLFVSVSSRFANGTIESRCSPTGKLYLFSRKRGRAPGVWSSVVVRIINRKKKKNKMHVESAFASTGIFLAKDFWHQNCNFYKGTLFDYRSIGLALSKSLDKRYFHPREIHVQVVVVCKMSKARWDRWWFAGHKGGPTRPQEALSAIAVLLHRRGEKSSKNWPCCETRPSNEIAILKKLPRVQL